MAEVKSSLQLYLVIWDQITKENSNSCLIAYFFNDYDTWCHQEEDTCKLQEVANSKKFYDTFVLLVNYFNNYCVSL